MKPNIIYVMPDEFRPYSMGFLGREKVQTPNLDRFAAEGTACTNVVSNFPICSPYRGILMSGMYPVKNGVTANCNSSSSASLKEDLYCLTDWLSDSGYETAYIGKWHLTAPGPSDEQYGEGMREDGKIWDCYTKPGKERHSIKFWHSYGCCDNHMNPHYWSGGSGREDLTYAGKWSAEHETDIALDYIENRNSQRDCDKPFALFLAYNPPHMPFDQVPGKYREPYSQYHADELLCWDNLTSKGRDLAARHVKNYYAMISGIDDQFGRILKALKEKGLEEDTIVIFTSDHGEMMGSHGLMHKDIWYNESLLVPFLIRYPGSIRENIQDDMLFSTVDIYPTIKGLIGEGQKENGGLDGTDVSQRLSTGRGKACDSALYLYMNEQDCASGKRGIKTDRYTLVFDKKGGDMEWLCFDNRDDPSQLRNVYGEDEHRDRTLKEELRKLLIRADDPFADMSL